MEQFFAVFNQVLLFLMIIIIGYCIVKFKVLDASYLPVISRLFTKIIVPFILFTYTANGATRADLVNHIYLLAVVACIFAVLLSATWVLPKILKLEGNSAALFKLVNSFGNVGFVGIPLLIAIYGERAMIFVVIYKIIDQVVFWTYGLSLSYPEETRPGINLKALKNMINPPIIAIALSFVVILLGIRLPLPVQRLCTAMANTGAALPFLYIGGVVGTLKLKKLVEYREIYIGIVFKMIALPICIFIILRAIGLDPEAVGTMTILFGLPAIGLIPMLASNNGSDEEYATVATIITTLASIFTLAFVSYITQMVL